MNLIAFICLFAASASAQATSQSETTNVEEVRAVVVPFGPEKSAMGSEPQNTQIELVVDPSQPPKYDAPDHTLNELYRASEEMRSTEYKEKSKNSIHIPVSVEDSKLVDNLKDLEHTEIQKFLDRKGEALQGVAKLFSFLKMKPSIANMAINQFNESFFASPKLLLGDTRYKVITPGVFAVIPGFGFNDWMMNQLKKLKPFRNLPERSGMYFALSLGVSIVTAKLPDGTRKIRIEPTIDFRHGDKFTGPFFLPVAAGFTFSLSYEARDNKGKLPLTQGRFKKISIPTFISSPELVAVSIPFGAPLVPGGGLAAVIDGSFHRAQLTPSTVPAIGRFIMNFFRSKFGSCRKSVGS